MAAYGKDNNGLAGLRQVSPPATIILYLREKRRVVLFSPESE